MVTRKAAEEEREKLNKKRISKMNTKEIVKSILITNYLSVLDNLSTLISQCPESIDREKNLSYWNIIVKNYLFRISNDPVLTGLVQQEDAVINSMNFITVDTLKEELKRFFNQSLILEVARPLEKHLKEE